MYDPDASVCRRAWLRCPHCPHDDCAACTGGTTCAEHWLYLLASDSHLVFVQCPSCRRRWWADTGKGTGTSRRPAFPPPHLPALPDEAA